MPIGFAEARVMAREMVPHLRDGMGTALVRQIAQLEHPDSNGFERNRALSRAQAIIALEDLIRAGTPPPTITLPYPLPPSSVGPYPPPNVIDIDYTVTCHKPGDADTYRIARTSAVSGEPYSDWTDELDDMVDDWESEYSAFNFVPSGFARTIF